MQDLASLEQRIRRLEDRAEINELIARYCLVMDNRDMAAMPDLFTPDFVVRSADGVMNSVGREAAVEMFRSRSLSFMYFVPTAEYLEAFGPGIALRNRAYDTAVAADWPEKLASWRSYYGK